MKSSPASQSRERLLAVASVTVRGAGASVVATVVKRKGAADEEMVAVPEVVEVAEVIAAPR